MLVEPGVTTDLAAPPHAAASGIRRCWSPSLFPWEEQLPARMSQGLLPHRTYYGRYYNRDFYSMENSDENNVSWKSLYRRAASCQLEARFPLGTIKDEQRQVQ